MTSSNLLTVVVDRWARTLSTTKFKIVAYLYRIADASPDRQIDKSSEEIAQATGLSRRTVLPALHQLNRDERRVIRILSHNKERTLIEIPAEHWCLPAGNSEPVAVEPPVIHSQPVIGPPVNNSEPVVEPPASIPELIFRMTKKRPTLDDIRELKEAVNAAVATELNEAVAIEDEEIVKALNAMLRAGFRYEGFQFLAGGVIHQLLVWKNPYRFR